MSAKTKKSLLDGQAAVSRYLDQVEKDLKAGHATEHTHRPALKILLEELLPGTSAINEPKRGKYGAPDYLIETRQAQTPLSLGYVEAKDVGVNLTDTEKGEQLGRYRAALPNLLLTDYLEFRWYVNGEKREMSAVLAHWTDKKLERSPDGVQKLIDLFASFGARQPQEIGTARELAGRMARLTHLIRTSTLEILLKGEASATLTGLLEAFRETVLPGLTHEDFSDMYAQTLAYGLFAARVNFKGTALFTRRDAAHAIPRTNPLLQTLFYTLTGPDLSDEPYVNFVDELAQLLAYADMPQILAEFGTQVRAEDPIVHFYETFLAQYNPRLREQRGVYYTPTPVVDYIVRSVDALLVRDFGLPDGLGDTQKTTFKSSDKDGQPLEISTPRLLIADPATGTATFPYQIIRLLRQRYAASENAGQWSNFVRDHLLHALYGFELMMAPYAVAHLKLSMELGGLDLPDDTDAEQEERDALSVQLRHRLNIYLTNTLEDPRHEITSLSGPFKVISDEAEAAGKIKADYPIMVVLGNPPYSGHSANKGQWIDDLLKGIRRDHDGRPMKGRTLSNYYEVDGQPLGERNPKWLQDDYVKFIRWAQWRIEETGAGIVAFITPHGYLDNPTFRGMRQSLSRTFDDIYVLDLHGNANKKEAAPDGSADQNVFDIRTGVAIGIFVRREGAAGQRQAQIHRADLWGDRESKYAWLMAQDVTTAGYKRIAIAQPEYIWEERNLAILAEYSKYPKITEIFGINSVGLVTGNDEKRVFHSAADADEKARSLKLYNVTQEILYRPFDKRWTIYHELAIERPRREVLSNMTFENISIITSRLTKGEDFAHVQVTNRPNEVICMSSKTSNNGFAFPLYLYPPPQEGLGLYAFDFPVDARGRTPNLSKKFITALSAAVGLTFAPSGETKGDPNLYTPEDVFHYIYAVLHSPSYRQRYADFLRSDFPRLPLPDSAERFRALGALGQELTDLHLLHNAPKLGGFSKGGSNEVAKGYPKFAPPAEGESVGKVMISPQQWFTGVPPEVWNFRVGGYQVAEKWLKDRRGRTLSFEDIEHYRQVLGALEGTIALMARVDEVAKDFWNPNSVEAMLSKLPGKSSKFYKDVDRIISENDEDFNGSIFRFIYETFRRVSTITNDLDYTEKWFYLPNPSMDGEMPIRLIQSLSLQNISSALDKLELQIDTAETEDA